MIKRTLSLAVAVLVLSSASFSLTLTSPFLNYPNPFKTRDARSGAEGTYFAYGLSETTNVEIRVYKMDGTLVWKRSFMSADPEGKAGYHEVFWDGVLDTGASSTSASGVITRETAPNGVLLSFLISNGKIIGRNKVTVFQ